jgi:hypothetical protein
MTTTIHRGKHEDVSSVDTKRGPRQFTSTFPRLARRPEPDLAPNGWPTRTYKRRAQMIGPTKRHVLSLSFTGDSIQGTAQDAFANINGQIRYRLL